MRVMRPRSAAPSTPITNFQPSATPVVQTPEGGNRYKRQTIDEPTVPTTPPPTTQSPPPITHSTIKSTVGAYGTVPSAGDASTVPTPPSTYTPPVADTPQTPWAANVDDTRRALQMLRGTDQMDYLNLLAVMEQNNGQLPTQQQKMRWAALQQIIYPNTAVPTQPVEAKPITDAATARTYTGNEADPFGWKGWADQYGDQRPVSFGQWLQRIPQYKDLGRTGKLQSDQALRQRLVQEYNQYTGVFQNPYSGKLNPFGGRKRFFVSGSGDQK